jgi:hypothetical protein
MGTWSHERIDDAPACALARGCGVPAGSRAARKARTLPGGR